MSEKRSNHRPKNSRATWLGLTLLALFVGSILWSMWAETVQPLLRAGDTRGVLLHLVGLPLILAGTAVIIHGGFVFVRDTFHAMAGEAVQANIARFRSGDTGGTAARWANARLLFRAWLPGLGRLALGFLLIAGGGFLINL